MLSPETENTPRQQSRIPDQMNNTKDHPSVQWEGTTLLVIAIKHS